MLTLFHHIVAAAAGESDEQHQKRVQCLCPSTYVFRLFTRKGVLLQPSSADPPVPACFVCGGSEITLQVILFPVDLLIALISECQYSVEISISTISNVGHLNQF